MPKTIFGTTEKSNFILNMRSETLQKLIKTALFFSILLLQIGALIVLCFQATTVWHAAFLYAGGFSCLLFYLIALLKRDILFKGNPSFIIIILMAIFTVISYYGIILRGGSDNEIKTALFGEQGRYEGLLSILAYMGIFLAAVCVTKKDTVKIMLDVFVGAGIIQALIAVLQHIPNLNFPSYFKDLPVLLLKNCMLSSGLSDSPVFYGSFLTIVSGISITGAIFERNITRARIYGCASVLFFLTGLFTSSIVPLIGIGAAVCISVIITLFNRKKGKKIRFESGLFIYPEYRLTVILSALFIVFILTFAFQGIYIRDKAIAYSDSFYRHFITGGPSPVNKQSLYEIAWTRSIEFIKQHPLTGIGPDNMALSQMSETLYIDSIDRSYNEYLYIACTRGVPSLLIYLSLLALIFKKLSGNIKLFFENNENWVIPAVLTVITAYSIQGFFSVSAITVAPFFWLLCGLAFSAGLTGASVHNKKYPYETKNGFNPTSPKIKEN